MTQHTIPNLSNEDYHHGEAYRDFISSSQLKLYLRSPAAYRYAINNPAEEKSEALEFGALFHSLMQCLADAKGEWNAGYAKWRESLRIFEPPINEKTGQPYGATTKAYKDALLDFQLRNEGLSITDIESTTIATEMAQSLVCSRTATSKQIRMLLKHALATEISCFIEDYGVKVKVRPDMLTRTELIDWKTCSLDSLDEESIVRQIIKYRYDVSMAMYQWTLHEVFLKWYKPILVFVSKVAPYDCLMVDISEWCYRYDKDLDMVIPGVGAMEFKRLLDLHAKCEREQSWPGAESLLPANDKIKILRPEVPYWFGRKYFEE